MKLKNIILTLIIMCSSMTMMASDSIFEKISDMDGVSTVHISKSMLRMFNSKSTKSIGGINIGTIAGKLNYIDIYSSESIPAIKKIRFLTKSIKTMPGYESLIKIKDDGSKVEVLLKTVGKISTVITIVDDGKEYTIIVLNGGISLEDIQSLTNQ
ncbi:MAG: DUF4252 domain-containing protein [Muribaculaceae bacterium]